METLICGYGITKYAVLSITFDNRNDNTAAVRKTGQKGEKTMANIAITLMTIVMMVCAGIKVM